MGWRDDRIGAPIDSVPEEGVDRRDFVKVCVAAAAAVAHEPARAGAARGPDGH